jgi:hypothetical protein
VFGEVAVLGGSLLKEDEFWTSLEFRVTRELSGMPRKHLGALWCDGIAPGIYWLSDEPHRIEGDAWIGYEDTNVWRFTLFLPKPVRSREEIEWSSLLPPENVTRWLAIDERRRILQIEPAAAVPDLE